jgi:hypothetical protein
MVALGNIRLAELLQVVVVPILQILIMVTLVSASVP